MRKGHGSSTIVPLLSSDRPFLATDSFLQTRSLLHTLATLHNQIRACILRSHLHFDPSDQIHLASSLATTSCKALNIFS